MLSGGEVGEMLARLPGAPPEERTRLLARLTALLYGDLKLLARRHRYRWGRRVAPGTTSLVHEAYLKLAGSAPAHLPSRRHFFAVASKTMRSILVDHARAHQRAKRGGGEAPLPIAEELLVARRRSVEVLALDDALRDLERQEPQLAEIVELRCFGGLTVEETAETLEISAPTVKRRWALARAWLYRELGALAPGAAKDATSEAEEVS